MARTVKDTALDTRAARLRLKARKKPYWRSIERGAHLGYYKGARGGSWAARCYVSAGSYRETTLGRADDILDSDGAAVLTFTEAQAKARTWFAEQARVAQGMEPAPSGPYTVAEAIRDYLAHSEKRGARGLGQTRSAANGHVLPALGNLHLDHLSTKRIRDWHLGLAAEGPRVRGRKGAAPKHRAVPRDPDARRKRQATANRVLGILKAALNHAWREGKTPRDDAWRRVAPFKAVDAPVIRYLSQAECVRLANACAPEFRPMVRAALLTGCRYSELAALRTVDYNDDAGTLAIRHSKAGKARHVVLTDEGRAFFAQATAGKTATALIFTRPDGGAWSKSQQQRPLAEACKRAKIAPAVSFHVLRHTHGSLLAMQGVPMAVIAEQLGHADTRMTEKHYAHLSPSYVADTIRANFPKLGIGGDGAVVPMRGGKRTSRTT